MSDVRGGGEKAGLTRRDALKRGAIAGGALLWTVPAVQVISMTRNAAEAASLPPGGNPNPPGGGGNPNPPGGGGNPNPPGGNVVEPKTPLGVEGEHFEQNPTPTATLPFTGAAVPVTGAVAVGAGLVATGVAAVAATRRRQQPAAQGAADADVEVDDGPAAV